MNGRRWVSGGNESNVVELGCDISGGLDFGGARFDSGLTENPVG